MKGDDDSVICEIDDDGIGRELSKQNKPSKPITHESKGVHISQARLNLEKMLNEKQAIMEIADKYGDNKPAGTKVTLVLHRF